MDVNAIKNVLDRNRQQPSIEEEELSKHECPTHMVKLKVKGNVGLCPFGESWDIP